MVLDIILLLLFQPWYAKSIQQDGEWSERINDRVSVATCPEGSVLVNCEIVLENEYDNHDGLRINGGDSCVAQNGYIDISVKVSKF